MWEWRRITELVKINSDIKKITNRSVSNSASGPEIKMRLNLSKAKLKIEENDKNLDELKLINEISIT